MKRAREAADALFKPRQETVRLEMSVPAQTSTSSEMPEIEKPVSKGAQHTPLEPAPRRAPRIIAVPSLMPAREEKTDAPAPARKKRADVAKPRAARLPKSDHDRIRSLAKYGMTTEQLVEHYDVPTAVIVRVIADDDEPSWIERPDGFGAMMDHDNPHPRP